MHVWRAIAGSAVAAALMAASSVPGMAGAASDPCSGRSDVLGVSRIVEVDTSMGPKFGAQYGSSFLEDGEVVLTFDDGPMRHYTQRILDALEAECTKATFFIVGRMAVGDPEMLKIMERRGHTIGIHTWGHAKLSAIGQAKAKDEIELGLSATSKALGSGAAPFFRYPYLADNKATLAYLASRSIGVFGIDIDSRDFETRSAAEMQKAVLRQLANKRKGIILFHDIQPSTANGIKPLLAELRARGFKIVHMVPKAPASTLADYDARAGDELARRVVAAAKNPLAKRAVTWPNGDAKPVQGTAAAEEVLPWLAGTSTEGAVIDQPAPAQKPKPTKRPQAEPDPWQIKTMGD